MLTGAEDPGEVEAQGAKSKQKTTKNKQQKLKANGKQVCMLVGAEKA